MKLPLADVWTALSGRPWPSSWPSPELWSVVVDSRLAGPNSMFVAIPGERVDGHSFVAHAFSRGAQVALVQRLTDVPSLVLDARQSGPLPEQDFSLPVSVLVDNTVHALQEVAATWRQRFQPRVIGITGSVGKTTTKEITAAVLSQRFATLRNPGNLNNEIGLPLTLFQLEERHQRVVLEMGMYGTGEIARLCEIARPQIAVVTNVGPVHLERLGSVERIAEAKAELVIALPLDGTAILNADDPLVAAMAAKTPARVFRYGLGAGCDLWADAIESEGLEGIRFRFHYGDDLVHVKVPLLGRHSVHTALRAAAVGLVEGLSWEEIVSGLQETQEQLRLVVAPGLHGATLLDDTYNASTASSLAALNLLADLDVNGGRRIAVLGDMLELGSYEEIGHRLVGARAAELVDYLITLGPRARWIGEEALSTGLAPSRVDMMATTLEVIDRLRLLIGPGDVVLVKGSRSLAMDEIVAALTMPRQLSSAGAVQQPEEA